MTALERIEHLKLEHCIESQCDACFVLRAFDVIRAVAVENVSLNDTSSQPPGIVNHRSQKEIDQEFEKEMKRASLPF